MNTFTNAVINQETTTTNGMKAFKGTASKNVDLFFKIGASRGKDVIPDFVGAYVENKDIALRIAQWARDVRQGSGERKIFRDILLHLAKTDLDAAVALINKVPELGRWDDLLIFAGPDAHALLKNKAFVMIHTALSEGNGLCAKWMPRKGSVARELREFFGWTPKYYRKRLVELTKVVETQMCAKQWEEINFSHVPSVASARYKKAFSRHSEQYKVWAEKLASGDKSVKVNAGAVYPYDVLKGYINQYYNLNYDLANIQHVVAQWEALPNYVGDASILPMVDVSGSMTALAGGHASKSLVTCLDVAVSLGLYLADKNKGKFKDTFLTFTGSPELLHLKGNVVEKAAQMSSSKWATNTDLTLAVAKILEVATKGSVPQSEMPQVLLILSDMQFDISYIRCNYSALEMIRHQYENAGYEMPKIVFWNLNAHDNVPVKFNQNGTALVSGFSPTIVKSVLAADLEQFTPVQIMLNTIMNTRYDI